MLAFLGNHWQMAALFLLPVISAIAIWRYAKRKGEPPNPNPDNLSPDSRISDDEPRIWGNDN